MARTPGAGAMTPPASLHATLQNAVPAIAGTCRDAWWIIGSAAMTLVGVDGIEPQDIDVLCSERDAQAMRDAWSRQLDANWAPADASRFRSRFARFAGFGMPVEVMGGLQVHAAGGWLPVDVADDVVVDTAGGAVRVPTRDEQVRILRLFGRDKDLRKAERIERLSATRAAHVH